MSQALPLSLRVDPLDSNVINKLQQLEAYDFNIITESAIRLYGWDRRLAKEVETSTKQFMALAFLDPGHYHIPEHNVDEYWHRMILHTQWYEKYCQEIFGAFYHHTPEPNMESVKDDNRVRTMKLADYWYGQNWSSLIMTCTQCRGPYALKNIGIKPADAAMPTF